MTLYTNDIVYSEIDPVESMRALDKTLELFGKLSRYLVKQDKSVLMGVILGLRLRNA